MGTGRYTSGTAGILTAGLAFGGYSSTANTANTESYNGTSWTEVGNLTVAKRDGASGGIQTAAFFAGGAGTPGGGDTKSNAQQLWDGTSWSNSSATLAVTRRGLRGTGASSSAGIGAGGYTGDNATVGSNATEEFNITVNTITAAAWASGGNVGTARRALWGGGTQTAGLIWGGYVGPPVENKTEEYNGSSWSEQNNLNTAGYHICGTGTQTAAVAFGRGTPPSGKTEEYNGTSWSEQNDMGTARYILSGFGVQTAAVAYGGGPLGAHPTGVPGIQTEHYDGTSWTAGGNYPEKNRAGSACGTQTAGLGSAGYSPDDSARTAEANTYDGSSWTAAPAMVIAKDGTFTSGSQTDAIIFLGVAPVAAQNVVSQKYDGTSWTTSASAATPRGSHAGSSTGGATGTAFAAAGGTPNIANTEEFTGETTALNLKTLTDS